MIHATTSFGRLCRARDMLRDVDHPLSIEQVAREAAVSPFHFIRQFQALFGETPHQYRIRARLERAKDLLESSDYSVTDVCMEVGFSSLGSFSDLFARRSRRGAIRLPASVPIARSPFPGVLPAARHAAACR